MYKWFLRVCTHVGEPVSHLDTRLWKNLANLTPNSSNLVKMAGQPQQEKMKRSRDDSSSDVDHDSVWESLNISTQSTLPRSHKDKDKIRDRRLRAKMFVRLQASPNSDAKKSMISMSPQKNKFLVAELATSEPNIATASTSDRGPSKNLKRSSSSDGNNHGSLTTPMSVECIELPPPPPPPASPDSTPPLPPAPSHSPPPPPQPSTDFTSVLPTGVAAPIALRPPTGPASPSLLRPPHRHNDKNDVPEKSKHTRPLNRLERTRSWRDTMLNTKLRQGDINWGNRNQARFRVMSYNVLAQNLLTDNMFLYKYHKAEHLKWPTRWAGLKQEIIEHQPDIVCFQEVQMKNPNHYQSHYLPFFTEMGYEGQAKCRTGRKEDGCAIFFKKDKFALDCVSKVEYLRKSDRLLDRDNVGLICRLTVRESKNSKRNKLVVGTTHLLFNKKRKDIRLAQIAMFLAELDKLNFVSATEHYPTILTGDLNAPVFSEVYSLIARGIVDYEFMETRPGKIVAHDYIPDSIGLTRCCRWVNCLIQRRMEDALVQPRGWLQHGLGFKSVYSSSELSVENHRNSVTTYHDKWITVDYMFYSQVASRYQEGQYMEGNLKLLSRFGLPSCNEMERVGPIPSDVCPSDHLMLLADFLLLM